MTLNGPWRQKVNKIKYCLKCTSNVLFALIKTKCLPILFYGVEACPTNSSVRQSFEFTMNKILFKVFGATSKDSCRYIYECLVLIMRTSLFVNVRTSSLINSVHQIIYVVWFMADNDWREFWINFSLPLFIMFV